MDKELIVVKGQVIEQPKAYTPEVGKNIGYEAGAKMIKNHYDQHPDDVVAHFMGRNIIENILSQPGCVGIRFFHGLNELGIRQLVLVGVDKDGKNILEYKIGDEKHKGIVADMAKACPPYCGSAEDDIAWW